METITPTPPEQGQTAVLRSGDLFGELEYIAASPAQEHGGFHPRVVAAATGALAEITRLRDEREWLQFVVNFVRLPLGIAPDVSNFDREKILAALDAALSSPNAKGEPQARQNTL